MEKGICRTVVAMGALGMMVLPSGCRDPAAPTKRWTLTLGAYTTPREVYGDAIIPAFREYWKAKTGEEVEVHESYLGSGAQARAIVGGFEADVAALSLEADVEKIAEAGLITHDWRAGPRNGMVTRSIAVIAVRSGNPKGIRDWDDLTRPDVEVLTPNPRTSGGAMWNIAAIYGAVLRGGTTTPGKDPGAAERFLGEVLGRVSVMDQGARESMLTFERGAGDAAVTYENEVLVGRRAGKTYEYVVPGSTILIENPVAVVDAYAKAHKNEDLARAFVEFLYTSEVQRAYGAHGLRPVDETAAREVEARLPRVGDLFTIRDLGGWPKVTRLLFGPQGVYDRLMASLGKS
jgi:sulfate/thiosulfate-binding protein